MTYREPLSQKAIGLSISESDDLAFLGLAEEHLRDAMTEISRHLLAMGARLVYGGDLRVGGYTKLLFELVSRHRRDADVGDTRPAIASYLAWPVHGMKPREYLVDLADDLSGVGELHCLDRDGGDMSLDRSGGHRPDDFTENDWAASLTAMREVQTKLIDARIVLGGRTTQFKGRMPGVAEEAFLALSAGRPLFLMGGFGGCARDIAKDMNLLPNESGAPDWPGREMFASWKASDLNNGLEPDELTTLARTVHVDEAVALILRGMLRLIQRSTEDV